jgi:flagellar operon protein
MSENINNITPNSTVISPEFIVKQRTQLPSSATFKEILNDKQSKLDDGIKFSGHALSRLEERNIELSSQDQERLKSAFDHVTEKGGKDSLVLMDSMAFVINAKNKTVVTAMSQDNLRDKVFTKIDSAVII